jgi:hypothetical protein
VALTEQIRYVSGEHFSSYSGISQEELLLVSLKTLSPFISLQTSALETCLGSNNSNSLPEEVIANSQKYAAYYPERVGNFVLDAVAPHDMASRTLMICLT